MWQAKVTIYNNTDYNLSITGVGPGNEDISGGERITWTSTEVNNTKSLNFWHTKDVFYLQGNLSFGPEAGVYVDRGWMAADDQSIKLTTNANETTYIQIDNGGKEILQWNQFEQGGTIVLTFDPQ